MLLLFAFIFCQAQAQTLTNCADDPSCKALIPGGLINPRHCGVVKCTDIYIAEVGTGNNDGRISHVLFPYSSITSYPVTQVVTGLPSSIGSGGVIQGPLAAHSSVSSSNAWVLIGAGPRSTTPPNNLYDTVRQFVGPQVPNGGTLPYADLLGVASNPATIFFTKNAGQMVVSDPGAHALHYYTNGAYTSTRSVAPLVPVSVTQDPQSNFYFATATNVYNLPPSGAPTLFISTPFTGTILDIGMDTNSNLYILEQNYNGFGRVTQYQSGQLTELVGPTNPANRNWLNHPYGMGVHYPANGKHPVITISVTDVTATGDGRLFTFNP